MNTLLTKHVEVEEGKTKAESVAEYIKVWENSRYLLRPLMLMLQERIQVLDTIKETDFDIPNHYAKRMYQEGKKSEAQVFLDLMPKSLKE